MPLIVLAIAGVVGMETFWGGLGVLVVSGMAWIAYQHPKAYDRIFYVLSGLCLAALLVLTGYLFGFNEGQANPAGKYPFDMTFVVMVVVGVTVLNGALGLLYPALGLKVDDVKPAAAPRATSKPSRPRKRPGPAPHA